MYYGGKRIFLLLRVSRAGLFSDLSAGDTGPLRIPGTQLLIRKWFAERLGLSDKGLYFTMKTHKTMLKNQSVFSYSWVARIFWIRPCRFL